MSKFSKPLTHHFGDINPHIQRINFTTLNELDNMTAKAPVYRELHENPYINNHFCKHHHGIILQNKENQQEDEPQKEEHSRDGDDCKDIIHVYKHNTDDDEVATTENPQTKLKDEDPRPNSINRFIKRQSATRW